MRAATDLLEEEKIWRQKEKIEEKKGAGKKEEIKYKIKRREKKKERDGRKGKERSRVTERVQVCHTNDDYVNVQ